MIDFVEICRRATRGRLVPETKFDRELFFPKIKELVRKYDIRADLENPVNRDDGSADAVFNAAVDLLSEVGIYCTDSQRIIELSRNEVLEGVREAPGQCWFGEDQDRRLYPVRRPDSPDVPSWCHIGGGVTYDTEDIAFKVVEGIARIPWADSISMPICAGLRDFPVTAGSPAGLLSCIRAVEITRSALRQSGRLGMPILNGIPGAGSAVETIAASCPGLGMRPSDGWIVGFLSELKVDYGSLNKCAFLLNIGGRIGSQGAPILGGYCGGPEGTAITNCAYVIAGILVMRGQYQLSFPVDINLGCSTTRQVLWSVGISSQAISRNIAYPFHMLGYCMGGPMTKSYFYETTAYLLTAIPSGASAQNGAPARAIVANHMTPLELEYSAEVIRCAHKVSRAEANEIVKRLVPKYEDGLATASTGKSYQECFDLKTGYPSEDYVDFYREIKTEIANMGVPFDY
jgi:hypothetical protein